MVNVDLPIIVILLFVAFISGIMFGAFLGRPASAPVKAALGVERKLSKTESLPGLILSPKKEIVAEVISNISLQEREDWRERVTVAIENKPVTDLHMLLIRICNAGDVPVLPHDYISPLKISFDGSRILDADVVEATREVNQTKLEVEHSLLKVWPPLLNSHDTITIKILLGNFAGHFSVSGRVIGIKSIIAKTSLLDIA